MEWWPIVAVIAAGAAALIVAATADRRKARRTAQVEAAPPDRHLPTLDPSTEPPAYVSDESARTPSPTRPAPDAETVAAAVADNSGLPGGWTDETFVTVPTKGWAAVARPMVLACTGVGSFRELLSAVTAAKKAGRGLVVIATAIEADALRTLAANAAQGYLPGVAVLCESPQAVEKLAQASGATVMRQGDLQSGWLPPTALGGCDLWVSSRTESWVVPTLDENPST